MKASVRQRLILMCALLSAIGSVSGEALPLRNGGFEESPPGGLPSGWQMWGHDAKRDHRDFAVDEAVAHSGRRSLRIVHPQGTRGYIVTAVRDNLIPVQSNRTYTLSFYARTDRPGRAAIHVEGQRAGAPQSARTVLGQAFQVGEAWQRFGFTVTEGATFFIDECDRLMLAIHAVPSNETQPTRTVWVDDVTVEEAPAPATQVRLLNPKTLAYEPLQHRLAAGDSLDVTVHADRPVRRATRLAGGVSFHRASGYMGLPYDRAGEYRMTAAQEAVIRDLRLPFTRFYAVGDETYPLEQAIDKIVHVLARCEIPQQGTVLEFETQGASTRLPPETWARGVKHARDKGYAFRHWEVSNEPWGKPAFASPDDYVSHLKAVGAAIRQVHPEGQIGVGIHTADLHWGNYILAAGAGHYDFVCGHWYSFINVEKSPLEAVAAGENYRLLDEMLRMNALLRRYNPGRDVCQYDTEWSLHSSAAGTVPGTPQNGNIVGALHRAVRLIYYLREDIVRGASAWEMFSSPAKSRWNALGLLAPDEDRQAAIYWAHRCVNEHVGEWVVAVDGTTPYYTPPPEAGDASRRPHAGPLVPLVAMRDAGGQSLTVIAANVSFDRTVPCALRLEGFVASSAEGVRLSQEDVRAHPLLERKTDLVTPFSARVENGTTVRCEIPPKSAVFLRLQSVL
jgi:hypothetical protein